MLRQWWAAKRLRSTGKAGTACAELQPAATCAISIAFFPSVGTEQPNFITLARFVGFTAFIFIARRVAPVRVVALARFAVRVAITRVGPFQARR